MLYLRLRALPEVINHAIICVIYGHFPSKEEGK